MKFRTQFDENERIISNPGSPIKIEYESYFDDKGNLELKESGKSDLYMDIQSHADSVDINVILARYANGDEQALNRAQGFYEDVTKMPTSMIDVMNLVMRGENMFNALPVEIKEKFDNNYAAWIASAGSEEWNDKMNVQVPDPVPTEPKEEIKE